MLYRKITSRIEEHLRSGSDKIMIVEGARQVGKSFTIRDIGMRLFTNYIELNFVEDAEGPRLFENVRTVEDFYLQVSMIAGEKMGNREDTLIFLDEIQHYPQLITLLKFLRQDGRFTYIASGSMLGIALRKTTSIPIGSIEKMQMYPLSFEEFLIANGVGKEVLQMMSDKFAAEESLDETSHRFIMGLMRKYLLTGGLPDAVNAFLETSNITKVRAVHKDIRELYIADAMKYENDNRRKLKVAKIYNMIPSFMENHKKRIEFRQIEEKKGARYDNYIDEFEYLISAGIALDVKAVTTPAFPVSASVSKNLLKLYLNDVGLLSDIFYKNNIRAIMDDDASVDLGAVYETMIAQEFAAQGRDLYYYDRKKAGEVDFLIDDNGSLCTVPVEVKSGKDYKIHSAIDTFISNEDYNVKYGIVLSNERKVYRENNIKYMPVYDVMFL